jgi:hypothetical protein
MGVSILVLMEEALKHCRLQPNKKRSKHVSILVLMEEALKQLFNAK